MGFGLGLWLWKTLDEPRRLLVAFLGLSGMLGVLEAGLRIAGQKNAWVGAFWELAIVSTLFSALVLRCGQPTRNVAKLIQLLALCTWCAYFLYSGQFGAFSGGFHAALCIVGVGLAALVIINQQARPEDLWLGWVTMALMAIDILPNAASCDWLGSKESARALWCARNGLWCVGYAAFAYSLSVANRGNKC